MHVEIRPLELDVVDVYAHRLKWSGKIIIFVKGEEVREFSSWTLDNIWRDYLTIRDAVEKLWEEYDLGRFWTQTELVEIFMGKRSERRED